MNILYCSVEVSPLVKVGGLADVMGNLPQAVSANGHTVSIVMPKYSNIIPQEYLDKCKYVGYMFVDVNWRHQYCGVYKLDMAGVTYYLLDNEFYFGGHVYGGEDLEAFAFFSKACLDVVDYIGQRVDVIHCNDWSSALVPVMFHAFYKDKPLYSKIKLVHTLHNMKYQGVTSIDYARDVTGLDNHYFDSALSECGMANALKGGIVYADAVTTVSPTYAREICSSNTCDWVARCFPNENKMVGILNGIDANKYNPLRDKLLCQTYGVSSAKKGKAINKESLQTQLGLEVNTDIPLIAVVSRLVHSKGIGLISDILPQLLDGNIQLVVIGVGESYYADTLRHYANTHNNMVFVQGTDVQLTHRIYAGSDILLMPSLHEPCGSTQQKAMRYGCLPIVRSTGGLCDTVIDYDEHTRQGNGFVFGEPTGVALLDSINRALLIYDNNRAQWDKMVTSAIRCDYSWGESARNYIYLYSTITGLPEVVQVRKYKPRTPKKAT